MPLNFPTSPAVNDQYTFAGRTWVWNGAAWDSYNPGITAYVSRLNGFTGGVTLAAGSGITLTGSANTITIATTGVTGPTGPTGPQGVTGPTGAIPTNYVISFNGVTGAVTGVTTSVANTFTALQTFNAGITAAGVTTGTLYVNGNGTVAADLTVNGDGSFGAIRNISGQPVYVQNVSGAILIGDGLGEGNGTNISVDDSNTLIELAASDFNVYGNSTFYADLNTGQFKVQGDSSIIQIGGIPPSFVISDANQATPNRVTVSQDGSMTLLNLLAANGGISAGASTFSGGITAPNIVNSVNGITGSVNLIAGTGITLSQSGKNLTITNTQAAGSVDKAFVIAMSIAL